MVPTPPSQDTIVDCQPDSSHATPWISGSRTLIAGGLGSFRLSVGRNGCPDAELIAAATSGRGATGPEYVGQLAPGAGDFGGGPFGRDGGGGATCTGVGLRRGALFPAGVGASGGAWLRRGGADGPAGTATDGGPEREAHRAAAAPRA